MNNNRYSLIHHGAEPIENMSFISDRKTARCVQGDEVERAEVETWKRVYQGIEFLKPKGRKLHDRNLEKLKARQR
jgi:hypothetical protein